MGESATPRHRPMVALAAACHPAPCVAVTAFAVLLAVHAGDGAPTGVLVGFAVLAGQLSIGWANDRLDAARDRAAGRTDKPLARGELSLRTVDLSIAVVLVLTVTLSFLLGVRAGIVHLAAVAFGHLYNIAFKSTWLSWVPYAVAFGALPAVASFAGRGHPGPAAWLVAAGAVLGVGAHLLNALPDLEYDARTEVNGLPQRIGAAPSLALASILLLTGSVVIVFGSPGSPGTAAWIGLAVNVIALTAGLVWQRGRPPSRTTFLGMIVVVAVNLVLLVTTG